MSRKRTLLSKGVYKDKHGIAIIVSVAGKPREFRKDEQGRKYSSFTPDELKRERKRIDARESLKQERVIEKSDTFAADVQTFLATISSKGHRVNTQGYMAHWAQHFADRQRNTITDIDAQTAYAQMDHSPSTKIHIRRALIQFYDTLNGKSGYNPGRSLKKPQKPEEPIRDLPWEWIERLFAALPDSRSKARLLLIAYIGLPQKQIAALQPSDLRLNQRELVVHPRRKGAGAAGRTIPLSDVAIDALKTFQRLDAFGTFQNRQLVETFWSGATKAGVTLPADARPYDLRHSFLTEVARGGADIRDIAHLGMHATIEQAARYVKGAAADRATNAITSVPRFAATTKAGKSPKGSKTLHQKPTPRAHKPRGKTRRNS